MSRRLLRLFPVALAVWMGACGGGADDSPDPASSEPMSDAATPGPGDDAGAAADASTGDGAGGKKDAGKDAGKKDGAGEGDGSTSEDGGGDDGGANADASSGSDGGSSDASSGDASSSDASTDGGAVNLGPLPSCSSSATVYGALPVGVNLSIYGSFEPGPLMLFDTRAFVFLEGSGQWTVASQGSASTTVLPAALTGGTTFTAWPSLSGRTVITFVKATKVWAVAYDGTSFGTAVETPCTTGGSACEARAAGDGHIWVYTQSNLHEQDGATFANRGGGPGGMRLWSVDASGTVIVVGGPYSATDVIQVWKLPAGAGGWTKTGALPKTAINAAAATIENGFQLAADTGAIAADGSIHLFSDARCIGTGQRNRTQIYMRSHDGNTWDVVTLPSADTLTGQLTWKHGGFWAGSYDHVRYLLVSSTAPIDDGGGSWIYPSRRYDLVERCAGAGGTTSFARTASVPHPGWTDRGFSAFSSTGVATMLTKSGLSQLH